jgi:3-oxoacyl-[acyl-carrier protein] reductase
MKLLENKVAIVTGGSRDIGAQVSIKLAQAGAKVCINYLNNKAAADATLQEITKNGGTAIIVQADVTKNAEVEQMIATCKSAFGDTIDILINVAGGIIARKLLGDMDEEFWDTVMNVNLKSAFLTTKAVVPNMANGGVIVNFSSQAARDGGGFGAMAYSTSKGAILTFTRGLAKELGPKGIRANCVSPGMINTTFHNTFTKDEVRKKCSSIYSFTQRG